MAWFRSNDIQDGRTTHRRRDGANGPGASIVSTLKDIKSFRTCSSTTVLRFIDGINSVTALAGVFGIVVFGLTTTGLILTILIIQFVAAPGGGFTKLADKWGKERLAVL